MAWIRASHTPVEGSARRSDRRWLRQSRAWPQIEKSPRKQGPQPNITNIIGRWGRAIFQALPAEEPLLTCRIWGPAATQELVDASPASGTESGACGARATAQMRGRFSRRRARSASGSDGAQKEPRPRFTRRTFSSPSGVPLGAVQIAHRSVGRTLTDPAPVPRLRILKQSHLRAGTRLGRPRRCVLARDDEPKSSLDSGASDFTVKER
jgi:hypothetical protein